MGMFAGYGSTGLLLAMRLWEAGRLWEAVHWGKELESKLKSPERDFFIIFGVRMEPCKQKDRMKSLLKSQKVYKCFSRAS